ncbi:hypothetical protein PLICRDRAFT_35060 [Plicaturopsis crispa FD-325 SS-3]|nr:hypothetical protein PLICRDRAFT_35060 [Plicaturopsis crispa FD-325 SS-3]
MSTATAVQTNQVCVASSLNIFHGALNEVGSSDDQEPYVKEVVAQPSGVCTSFHDILPASHIASPSAPSGSPESAIPPFMRPLPGSPSPTEKISEEPIPKLVGVVRRATMPKLHGVVRSAMGTISRRGGAGRTRGSVNEKKGLLETDTDAASVRSSNEKVSLASTEGA